MGGDDDGIDVRSAWRGGRVVVIVMVWWSGGGDVVLGVCIVDWWDAVGVDTVVHGV